MRRSQISKEPDNFFSGAKLSRQRSCRERISAQAVGECSGARGATMQSSRGIVYSPGNNRDNNTGIPTTGATELLKAWIEFRRVQNALELIYRSRRTNGKDNESRRLEGSKKGFGGVGRKMNCNAN